MNDGFRASTKKNPSCIAYFRLRGVCTVGMLVGGGGWWEGCGWDGGEEVVRTEGTMRHSGSRKVCVRQRHGSVARTTCGG